MKQLKKWTALLLALMLMITMVPWTAKAEFTEPTGTITVKGVEEGAIVKAYRLTEAKFDANGNFLKYENLIAGAFADPQKPTNAEWSELIKKPVGKLGDATTLSADGANYTATGLKAGLYMILVTSSKGMVYNPMIVGLSYAKDANGHKVTGGEIQVPQNFNLDTKGDAIAYLYAKKSEVTLTKTTVDPSPEDQSNPDSKKGNGLGLNEKPEFTITTTIPSYPETDKELKFTITDTLDPGLTPPKAEEVKVQVDGEDITAKDAKVTVNGQVITIDFTQDFLKGHRDSREVVVTYSATLNEKATVNFVANKNTVEVEYTNDPKNEKTSKHEDRTYHYTFDIDGKINGEKSEQTHEITKHGEQTTNTDWKKDPLNGAMFGIYKEDPSKNPKATPFQTVETKDGGRMNFTKLDEGLYYIKETQAPAGFSLNTTVHTVEILTEYNTDGTLKTYTIKIDGKATTSFEATYENKTVKTIVNKEDNPTLIYNTKTPELPTTGGMGTYLFTGIGVALLVGAAVMVTVLRKKNAQDAR
ncbi:isopeptide-forming domain-containing fimbrial protein [Levyella massiliensis]|uniref:isopeptide-forming domain-containing fimbrial protein n=1 Tax=Levyella massiliensis TaxID=938289 RepID=UPI003EBB7607